MKIFNRLCLDKSNRLVLFWVKLLGKLLEYYQKHVHSAKHFFFLKLKVDMQEIYKLEPGIFEKWNSLNQLYEMCMRGYS